MLMNVHASRLATLRKELQKRGLHGFVVPISDEHMSEYVGAYAQRLEWLTGFNGSAGTAVVMADQAAIFVDGRYTLQVRDQVDGQAWSFESVPQTSVAKWLEDNAAEGATIGYDAWLHTRRWVDGIEKALKQRGASLEPVNSNPIDAIWSDRPVPSPEPARVHPVSLAGEASEAKRAAVGEWLIARKCDAAVITALDSVAWLLNIRGSDVARTPVVLSFAIVHADGATDLFLAPKKVTPELCDHLGNGVRIRTRDEFVPALHELAGKKVAVDPERAVHAVFAELAAAGAEVTEERDPTVLPRACKNAAEIAGHRAAQARDGAAMARFLHWLSREGPRGGVDEIAAAGHLHRLRGESGELHDLSFDTISGSGPNGAIVHYRVSEQTNRKLEPGSVYLVDSGGQYPDGTTDITRTVWIGPDEPSPELKDRFTRVLKGNIAISSAVFPKGTTGSHLDALARVHLWAAGLDYAHGTGHGVGSFLSVHEGPQRIAKPSASAAPDPELLEGMIISNEPGYYKAGEYGIRIEHLLLVEPREIKGAEGAFLGFEVLTLCPIERKLIDCSLLTRDELAWWNAYHARVAEVIAPQLEGEDRAWLEDQCQPLSQANN